MHQIIKCIKLISTTMDFFGGSTPSFAWRGKAIYRSRTSIEGIARHYIEWKGETGSTTEKTAAGLKYPPPSPSGGGGGGYPRNPHPRSGVFPPVECSKNWRIQGEKAEFPYG